MTEGRIGTPIERILVALDSSPHSLAALEAAAELAALLHVELLGIFVEDINLLRIAELPFSQEVGHYSARRRRLDRGQMAQQLRAQANWARRAFIRAAENREIKWSFRITRGSIPTELISATTETDLIILGKTGWANFQRLGSTAMAVVAEAPQKILVLQRGVRLGFSVFVLIDPSDPAMEALTLATQLVHAKKGYLTVIIIADDEATAKDFQGEISKWLRDRGIIARHLWLQELDPAIICEIVHVEEGGVLVVSNHLGDPDFVIGMAFAI